MMPKSSYNEYCPACGAPTVSVCRCKTGHATCANGHEYKRSESVRPKVDLVDSFSDKSPDDYELSG